MKNLILVFFSFLFLIFTSSFFIADAKCEKIKTKRSKDYVITLERDTIFGKVRLNPRRFKPDGSNGRYKKISPLTHFAYCLYRRGKEYYFESVYMKREGWNNGRMIKLPVELRSEHLLKSINGYYSLYGASVNQSIGSSGGSVTTLWYCIGKNTKENPIDVIDLDYGFMDRRKKKVIEGINKAFSEEKEFLKDFNSSDQNFADFISIIKKHNKLKQFR